MPLPTNFESYKLLIREHHLDTYGHVNNATYMVILEEARWEMLEKRGIGFNYVHTSGCGPVVLGINIKFRKEIKLRQWITIKTRFTKWDGKFGELEQLIEREDGVVACESSFSFGFFDLKERKLAAPPRQWLDAVGI